jgi:hypothetical protein
VPPHSGSLACFGDARWGAQKRIKSLPSILGCLGYGSPGLLQALALAQADRMRGGRAANQLPSLPLGKRRRWDGCSGVRLEQLVTDSRLLPQATHYPKAGFRVHVTSPPPSRLDCWVGFGVACSRRRRRKTRPAKPKETKKAMARRAALLVNDDGQKPAELRN